MKRVFYWGVAGCVVLAVAGGVAGWRWTEQRRAAEGELSALGEQAVVRAAELARARDQLAQAREKATKATSARAALSGGGTDAGKNAVPVVAAVKLAVPDAPDVTMGDFIKRSYATAERKSAIDDGWRARRRTALAQQYEAFFRTHGLDERQQQAFVGNLQRRDEQQLELNEAAMAQGFRVGDAAITKLRGGIFSDYEVAQRTLLGEGRYGAMVEFDRTSGLRALVGSMAGTAAVAGAALTPAQTGALLRAMAEESGSYQRGGSAMTATVNWDKWQARLPEFLDEAQVKIITTMEAASPTGGLLHVRWNDALSRATKAEAERKSAVGATGGEP
jgi:hypothetical protein